MKNTLLLALMLVTMTTEAGQRVWLHSTGSYFDPDNPTHRRNSYFELPLKAENERYKVQVYYANGQLKQEGWTRHPEWQNFQLVGDFKEWYPNGQEKMSGHFEIRDQICQCGHDFPVRHGTFTEYHANGQLKHVREYYANQLVDGDYEEFDQQGRLVKKYSFLNARYEGDYQEYQDGQLSLHYRYLNGQLDGYQTTYRKGIKILEHQYKNGEQIGVQQAFHDHGGLRRSYVMGPNRRSEGEDVTYRIDGSLERRINHVLTDQGVVAEQTEERFHQNGDLFYRKIIKGSYVLEEEFDQAGAQTKRSESNERGRQGLYIFKIWGGEIREHYRDDRKHGHHLTQHSDGSLVEGHYRDGLQEGAWRETRTDGSVLVSHYHRGQLHGLQEELDPEGRRKHFANYLHGVLHGAADRLTYRGREIAQYRNDIPHGNYRLLTEDGRLLHQGQYLEGEPDGVHYRFEADGRLLARESYNKGVPHGDWVETDYEGRITRKASFQDGKIITDTTVDYPLSDSMPFSL